MSATARAFENTETLDLAALRQMTYGQLDQLYRTAQQPATISALDGHARGAMLAW